MALHFQVRLSQISIYKKLKQRKSYDTAHQHDHALAVQIKIQQIGHCYDPKGNGICNTKSKEKTSAPVLGHIEEKDQAGQRASKDEQFSHNPRTESCQAPDVAQD